jgi:hypothetical protein
VHTHYDAEYIESPVYIPEINARACQQRDKKGDLNQQDTDDKYPLPEYYPDQLLFHTLSIGYRQGSFQNHERAGCVKQTEGSRPAGVLREAQCVKMSQNKGVFASLGQNEPMKTDFRKK